MENLKVVGDAESFDWRDRSFVRVRKGGEVEDWAPPTIPEDVNLHHCGAESALGLRYALDMIEHLRTHRGKVVGDRLCTVVKEIVEQGPSGRVWRLSFSMRWGTSSRTGWMRARATGTSLSTREAEDSI